MGQLFFCLCIATEMQLSLKIFQVIAKELTATNNKQMFIYHILFLKLMHIHPSCVSESFVV